MASFGLQGKVAVVTGAAQGIGAATAKKFAENGAQVVLVDVKEPQLNLTTSQLAKQFPNQEFHSVVCDVGLSAEVDKLASAFAQWFKSADVVVNNAAIVHIKSFLDTSDADFDRILATNLKSIQLVSQVFVRMAVAESKPLAIVNVSSITTHAGMAQLSGYVASKSGVVGLTKVMAKELGRLGIRVNAVLPGFVDTPMNDHLNEENRASICRQTPLGRISAPSEIANVILFLGSELASFCNASLVDVNGGMTL